MTNQMTKKYRRVCGDMVTTDMDQIGTMAKYKLFNEEIFLQRVLVPVY